MKMPYCSQCTIDEEAGPSHAITTRQRVARAVAGAVWLALAWAFLRVPVPAIAWPLAIIAGWFGISHLAAACIAYADCPELGAIATLVSRRYIRTRCGPWLGERSPTEYASSTNIRRVHGLGDSYILGTLKP